MLNHCGSNGIGNFARDCSMKLTCTFVGHWFPGRSRNVQCVIIITYNSVVRCEGITYVERITPLAVVFCRAVWAKMISYCGHGVVDADWNVAVYI